MINRILAASLLFIPAIGFAETPTIYTGYLNSIRYTVTNPADVKFVRVSVQTQNGVQTACGSDWYYLEDPNGGAAMAMWSQQLDKALISNILYQTTISPYVYFPIQQINIVGNGVCTYLAEGVKRFDLSAGFFSPAAIANLLEVTNSIGAKALPTASKIR